MGFIHFCVTKFMENIIIIIIHGLVCVSLGSLIRGRHIPRILGMGIQITTNQVTRTGQEKK